MSGNSSFVAADVGRLQFPSWNPLTGAEAEPAHAGCYDFSDALVRKRVAQTKDRFACEANPLSGAWQRFSSSLKTVAVWLNPYLWSSGADFGGAGTRVHATGSISDAPLNPTLLPVALGCGESNKKQQIKHK